MEEAVKKIEAAVAAKSDPDFVINARTDAIAVAGVDEAIRRGNAYAKAGADLIFVEAPTNEDDIKRVIQSIDAPVSINLLYGRKTPAVPISKIAQWGAARVSIPIQSLMNVTWMLEKCYRHIMEKGEIVGLQSESYDFSDFTSLVGLPFIKELEKKYLNTAELEARYKGEANAE